MNENNKKAFTINVGSAVFVSAIYKNEIAFASFSKKRQRLFH